MNSRIRAIIFWLCSAIGVLFLHWFFAQRIGMPVATVVTLSLIILWLHPRPFILLCILAAASELLAVTKPMTMVAGVFGPLIIFWLRGRISVDISFSYTVVVAASAALSLALVTVVDTYPYLVALPWARMLGAWLAVTCATVGTTVLWPSLKSRYLHDRHY